MIAMNVFSSYHGHGNPAMTALFNALAQVMMLSAANETEVSKIVLAIFPVRDYKVARMVAWDSMQRYHWHSEAWRAVYESIVNLDEQEQPELDEPKI